MNEEKVLLKYLPEKSVHQVIELIKKYNVHLKITRERKTKLGDYRPPGRDDPTHRISINYNLNKYSFLLTFVHELAHLVVWNDHKNRVMPHGSEWKKIYNQLIQQFLTEDIFPEDILKMLDESSKNFKASTGSDINLMRVLSKYDTTKQNNLVLENLEEGELFMANNNMVFKKGKKRRTRFLCIEQSSKKLYLFHPLTPVTKKVE